MQSSVNRGVACAVMLIALGGPVLVSQDYKTNLPADHPAIDYAHAPVDDAAAALGTLLERGTVTLTSRSDALGILPALLDRLHVNADSQMLVFSKTSFQAARIAPDHPRAIYFNDDVMVAYVPGAPTLELAAIDPRQGPIFYTMAVSPVGRPAVGRGDTCLRCHQGPNTAGVPGIYVGSVVPGPNGAPLRDDSAIITDHRSPFRDRWGGWYVTARRGEQLDRANAVASNPAEPETLVRESRQNVTSLAGRFDGALYLATSSDIVALMTFEHQTQMTNLITRVGWDARIAEHGGGAAGSPFDSDVEDLVAYMLFADEAGLVEPIEGVSSFARTFPERGPRDRHGRSLRDFDLHTRLFKYPLSYLIYSAAFDALPSPARERIYRRLHEILTGADRGARFAGLSRDDRRAILEIVGETKRGLPAYWNQPVAGSRNGRNGDGSRLHRAPHRPFLSGRLRVTNVARRTLAK